MCFTFETINFLLTSNYFLFGGSNEGFEPLLLLLGKGNVGGSELRALGNDSEKWQRQIGRRRLTVFLSLRSASCFVLYASPTALHVSAQTPEGSSEPSQHSGSYGGMSVANTHYHAAHSPHLPSFTRVLGMTAPMCPAFLQ